MKKENQKMAKERKALEKKRQARKTLTKKICMYLIPALIMIGIIAFCVTYEPASDDDTSTSDASESTSYTLLTDTSLEVQDGDTVNIDYVGSIDGVEFEGGSTGGAGTYLTIGSGSYIDDFEEQLIGSHPGDVVEVYVTFPEDYGVDELNGKEALFVVTINGIYG